MKTQLCLALLLSTLSFFAVATLSAQDSDVLWMRAGQREGFAAADISPDNSRIATTEMCTGTVRLWNALNGHLIAIYRFDPQLLSGFCDVQNADIQFSPDGSIFVATGPDSLLNVFDGFTGEHFSTLATVQSVTAVAFTGSGDTLLAGNTSGSIYLLNAATFTVVGEYRLGGDEISELHPVAAEGRFLAVFESGRMQLIVGATGEVLRSLNLGDVNDFGTSFQYPFASSKRTVAAVHFDVSRQQQEVILLDAITGDSLGVLQTNCAMLDITENGDTLYTLDRVSPGGFATDAVFMRRWLVSSGQQIDSVPIELPESYTQSGLIRVMPDRKSVLLVGNYAWGIPGVKVHPIFANYAIDGSGEREEYLALAGPANAIRPLGNTQFAVTSRTRGNYRVLDVRSAHLVAGTDYAEYEGTINLSPDGNTRIASSFVDESLTVRTIVDPEGISSEFARHWGVLPEAWVSDNANMFALGLPYDILELKDRLLLFEGGRVDTVSANVALFPNSSVTFSFGDNPAIAFARKDNSVVLYETATRSIAHVIPLPVQPLSLTFSQNNNLVACGRADGVITLIDRTSGNVVRNLLGHSGAVHDVQFARHGFWLVSAGADSTVRTWNVMRFAEDHVYRAHGTMFVAVGVTPDGTFVLGSGEDGTLVCWRGTGGIGSVNEKSEVFPLSVQVVSGENIQLILTGEYMGTVKIELVDIVGRHVHFNERYHAGRTSHHTISLGGLASGTYILSAAVGDAVFSRPIIIQQ